MALIAVPLASSGGGSSITLLLPLILIIGMIWFMSRSQRKQRQKQADTVAALTPGTKVVTTSGMVGIVEEVDDEYVTLEVSDGMLVQFLKAAVGRVIPEDTDAADPVDTTEPADATDDEVTPAAGTTAVADRPGTDAPAATAVAGDPKNREKSADQAKLPPTHTEN